MTLRNILCRLGRHKWEYGTTFKGMSTAAIGRTCQNCSRIEELITWFGAVMGKNVIQKGSLRK